ncbi:hypothetical protein [Kribbella sp.]|uniref:hypothetical protein n=1 Tax=Kribbella sp. TaxID=1871183 RepID=UPI002D23F573|nr:hypothetical protein [Kribbella sp.]HZX02087.1 hypothetical protein [Kribbella sp.]
MTYELRIGGFATTEDALAHQDPIARLLCPDPDHNTPCEVPWAFSMTDNHDLLLGIYTTPPKATEITNAVRHLVGHQITLTESLSGNFEELAEQYRIEHPNKPQ